MSVPSNRDFHYKNLRDRYANCTYVDGNLKLTWIQNNSYDLSFLQHIREVTGYVLISHVDTEHVKLPHLQIIRGRTLFKLNVWNSELKFERVGGKHLKENSLASLFIVKVSCKII